MQTHDAIGVAQMETRGVLETVTHRLERLETSPVPKFVARLDLNPSLSSEMTVPPHHSEARSSSLEARSSNPEVSMAPVALRRSERLVNKPEVDYRQIALQPRWPISTAVNSNLGQTQVLYPSSSFTAFSNTLTPQHLRRCRRHLSSGVGT